MQQDGVKSLHSDRQSLEREIVPPYLYYDYDYYLRAVGRKVLWLSACVCLSVCLCLCALFLSAIYLKNWFMDHHQIWWVGAGGEPLE